MTRAATENTADLRKILVPRQDSRVPPDFAAICAVTCNQRVAQSIPLF
jgi:hypothetical protein